MKYGYATEDGAGCHLHFIGAYTRLGLPTPSSEFCCCCCCCCLFVCFRGRISGFDGAASGNAAAAGI